MKEIVFGLLLTGAAFVGGVVLITLGVARKRNLLIIISLVCFLLALGCGGVTAYRFLTKSYRKVRYSYEEGRQKMDSLTEIFTSRSGEEIYAALLGPPIADCVEVLHYQDQIIPKIDYAIFLHIKACPEEMDRLLKLYEFDVHAGSGEMLQEHNDWFLPSRMGDSITVYDYRRDEYGNGLTIYMNREKTEAYIMDASD